MTILFGSPATGIGQPYVSQKQVTQSQSSECKRKMRLERKSINLRCGGVTSPIVFNMPYTLLSLLHRAANKQVELEKVRKHIDLFGTIKSNSISAYEL